MSKSIFDFKRDLVGIKKPENEMEELFKDICELVKTWGVDPDSIKISKVYEDQLEFEKYFLEDFIKTSLGLPENILWKNLISVDIVKKVIDGPYKVMGESISITFNIRTRKEILKNISGDWVYDNIEEVKDFMNIDNPFFIKLYEVNRLFPRLIIKNYDI